MNSKKKISKKKKIFLIVLSIVIVLIVVGDLALSVMVYNENFNQRFESYKPLMLYVDILLIMDIMFSPMTLQEMMRARGRESKDFRRE